MPVVTPMSLIFKVFSDLTGGLVNDITTAMVAMLTIGFILMGFDYIKDVIETGMRSRSEQRHIDKAHENMGMSAYYESGENSNDVLASMYKQRARKHITAASKMGD